jgi:hypothetical protein
MPIEYSQTFLGREIFRAWWQYTTLSALAAAERIVLPFGRQLADFAANFEREIDCVLTLTSHVGGLSEEVMRIAADEADWCNGDGTVLASEEDVQVCVGLALPPPRLPEAEVGTPEFHRLLPSAAKHQLVNLFDGLLDSHYAFVWQVANLPDDRPLALLARLVVIFEACRAIGQSVWPFPGERNAFAAVFAAWRLERLPEIMDDGSHDERFLPWLTGVADYFGGLLTVGLKEE